MKVSMRVWVIIIIFSVLILGLFGTLDDAFAETFNAVSSGNYDSQSTWQDETGAQGVPGVDDDKNIDAQFTVTISNSVTNSGLIFNLGTLVIDATFTNTGFFDGETTRGVLNSTGTWNCSK